MFCTASTSILAGMPRSYGKKSGLGKRDANVVFPRPSWPKVSITGVLFDLIRSVFMPVPNGDGFVFRCGKVCNEGDQPFGLFLRYPSAVATADSAAELGAVR